MKGEQWTINGQWNNIIIQSDSRLDTCVATRSIVQYNRHVCIQVPVQVLVLERKSPSFETEIDPSSERTLNGNRPRARYVCALTV